jgi:hypothetical protein
LSFFQLHQALITVLLSVPLSIVPASSGVVQLDSDNMLLSLLFIGKASMNAPAAKHPL